MPESGRTPVWLYVVFGLELLLTVAFFLLGWSMTVSLGQGRPAALVDILLLASPVILVIPSATLARFAVRRQKKGLAVLLAIVPLPFAFFLFGVVGAI